MPKTKTKLMKWCRSQANAERSAALEAAKWAKAERSEGFDLLADLINARAREAKQEAAEWQRIAREASKATATAKPVKAKR